MGQHGLRAWETASHRGSRVVLQRWTDGEGEAGGKLASASSSDPMARVRVSTYLADGDC